MASRKIGICLKCAVKSELDTGYYDKCLKCGASINGYDNEVFYIIMDTGEIFKRIESSGFGRSTLHHVAVQPAGFGSANLLLNLGSIDRVAKDDTKRSTTVICRSCTAISTNVKSSKCTECRAGFQDVHQVDLAKLKTISKESIGVCIKCTIRINQKYPLGKCPRCNYDIDGFDDDEYYIREDTEEVFVRITVASRTSLARKVLYGAAAGVGLVGAEAIAIPLIGFSSIGIVGNSFAAWMMSTAATYSGGGVAAGGLVATLQSLGALGVGAPAYFMGAGVGASAAGVGFGASGVFMKNALCHTCKEVVCIYRGTSTCPKCKGETQDILFRKIDVSKFTETTFKKSKL